MARAPPPAQEDAPREHRGLSRWCPTFSHPYQGTAPLRPSCRRGAERQVVVEGTQGQGGSSWLQPTLCWTCLALGPHDLIPLARCTVRPTSSFISGGKWVRSLDAIQDLNSKLVNGEKWNLQSKQVMASELMILLLLLVNCTLKSQGSSWRSPPLRPVGPDLHSLHSSLCPALLPPGQVGGGPAPGGEPGAPYLE